MSGSCRATQSSFGAVKPGMARLPATAVQFRRAFGQFGAFLVAAHVVPEDRRTQHAIGGIEQHRAVHLSRQADAAHLRERVGATRAQLRDGFAACRATSRPGLCSDQRGCGRETCERRARRWRSRGLGGEQQDFHFGRAEVDAEIHGRRNLRR